MAALTMPEASIGGGWPHRDRCETAAAYAFHLRQNDRFMNWNRRTALASALVFLELNGVSVLDPEGRAGPSFVTGDA